jgi:hypothetical protein
MKQERGGDRALSVGGETDLDARSQHGDMRFECALGRQPSTQILGRGNGEQENYAGQSRA